MAVKPCEPVKDSVAVLGRNTRSIVTDTDRDPSVAVVPMNVDSDSPLRTGVPNRVIQQIPYQLLQKCVVPGKWHF